MLSHAQMPERNRRRASKTRRAQLNGAGFHRSVISPPRRFACRSAACSLVYIGSVPRHWFCSVWSAAAAAESVCVFVAGVRSVFVAGVWSVCECVGELWFGGGGRLGLG